MKDCNPDLPLERKMFTVEINGTKKDIPGINKMWVDLEKRTFSRYMAHPSPVNGQLIMGEKETWMEFADFVIEDLEWLLQQKHHIFWSHMIFSKEAQQLLVTFLQEAPPYYLRDQFPKDEKMEKALRKIEHLVFLVFIRLSTEKESTTDYIQNLGALLYDNYIFTVPILLDICLIYGITNRQLVSKMLETVIAAAHQYLDDFKEIVPHFLHVFSLVRDKFENRNVHSLTDKLSAHRKEITDLVLHLYDSVANVNLFIDIYSNGSKLFRSDSFVNEVSSFYSIVIPRIYSYFKRNGCDLMESWNFKEKINEIRLNLLSIIRNIFSGILNDVFNDCARKGDYANEYLTQVVNILQDSLFLSDYNSIYEIENDLRLLKDTCQDMDPEVFLYVSEAIAPLKKTAEQKGPLKEAVKGVELESLITEVKDVLPHLRDGFIEACIHHYNYSSEKVIAAILENNVPPEIKKLGQDSVRAAHSAEEKPPADVCPKPVTKREKWIAKNQETYNFLNDRADLGEFRNGFSSLTLAGDEYDDEYDDTYDDKVALIRASDDVDQERRPFVTPRILSKERESEDEEEEEEEEEKKQPSEESGRRVVDQFVPNPEEIRAKQKHAGVEKGRRDYVGRGRGQGQDKKVITNRDYKDTHKSSVANHNRRKLALRKRNMPLVHS